jgi:hypothetical protein
VKSSSRSRNDSKENQKAQRPDSAFESGGRPAAGMKSKVCQCLASFIGSVAVGSQEQDTHSRHNTFLSWS